MAMRIEATLCLAGSAGSTISATSDAQQPEPVRIAKPVPLHASGCSSVQLGRWTGATGEPLA